MADTTGFDWTKFLELAIPAGATALSGYLGYNASKGAAQTQSQAAANALEFEKQMFATQQGNLAPYLATGRTALSALLQGMGLAPFSFPGGGGPGGEGSPFAPNSPYGSPLLGNLQPAKSSNNYLSNIGGLAGTGAAIGGKVGGPLGAGVGAAAGGVIGTLKSLIGSGRRKEDATVAVQNQVAAEVDRITKAVNSAQQNGTLTKEDLTQAVQTVKGLQDQFGTAVKGQGKAGEQGVATLAKYFDPMTSMWQSQLNGTATDKTAGFGEGQTAGQWNFAASAQPTAGGAPGSGTPGAPGLPFAQGYFAQTPDANTLLSQDPGYQARLDEGQKQLDRFFSSRGLGTSGGAAKSAGRYGQTFASNEYQNAFNRYQQQKSDTFNRLATLAGLGQTSTGTSANLATSLAASGGNLITDIGNAQAAGQVGSTNAVTGALTGGANLFNQAMQLSQIQNYLQQNRLPTYGPPLPNSPASPVNPNTGIPFGTDIQGPVQ